MIASPHASPELLAAEPPSNVPDWFSRRRATREARAAAEAVRTTDPVEPAAAVDPWTIRRAFVSFGASLTVHLALLVVMSLIALHVTQDGGSVSTELGVPGETGEELLDTRAFEIAGGADAAEAVPTVATIPTETELEVPSDLASPTPSVAGGATGTGTDSQTAQGTGQDDRFEVPAGGNAVTKGSFTAWTVPADPRVGQDYMIVVEVDLPDDVDRYARDDLSGTVVGTDGYLVAIPDGREYNGVGWSRPRRTPVFRKADGKARVMFFVRGARERLVTDTITVRSKLLDEQQKLQILF